MRSCYKYNIDNVSNYFLIKAGMCYFEIIKSLKVKLIKYKRYTETVITKTTDEQKTGHRRTQTSHRPLQTSHRRVIEDYRRVTDES